jgi:hypothetical protein
MITIDTIKHLRPSLTDEDFMPFPTATIVLRDDADGHGARIVEWNHPTETRLTDEELA